MQCMAPHRAHFSLDDEEDDAVVHQPSSSSSENTDLKVNVGKSRPLPSKDSDGDGDGRHLHAATYPPPPHKKPSDESSFAPTAPTAPTEGASSSKTGAADAATRNGNDRKNKTPPAKTKNRLRLRVPGLLMWIPPHLNWKGIRPVVRSSVAAWCGFVLLLAPSSQRTLGQAGFLVLVVAMMSPSSNPTATQVEFIVFQIFFVAGAWAWSCLGLFLAHLSRTRYRLTKSQFNELASEPYLHQGLSPSAIANEVQRDLFHGRYLETPSSILCCAFLSVGGAFLLWLRGKLGPGPALFGIIFGIIMLSITLTMGALFPYPWYSIGNIFFLPFICQEAIQLACAFLIVPETVGHQFCDRLIATLNTLSQVIVQQKNMLETDPISEEWLQFRSVKSGLTAAVSGLATMSTSESNLTRDVAYANVPGKDWIRVLGHMRLLVSRTSGFVFFYEVVEKRMHREYSDQHNGRVDEDLVIHLGGSRRGSPSREATPPVTKPPSVHIETPVTPPSEAEDAPQSHSRGRNLDNPNPNVDDSIHFSSPDHLNPAKRRGRSSHRANLGKSLSHISVSSLLHEVLHPNVQVRSVGLDESLVYANLEDYLHNAADEAHIQEIISLLSHASHDLLEACSSSLNHVITVVHRIKTHDSSWRRFWKSKPSETEAHSKKSAEVLSRLKASLEAYRDSKRLEVVRPFASLFDPLAPRDQERMRNTPSHRGLFWAFSFQFSLLQWAQALLDVTTETAKIEKVRSQPKLWTPEWAKFRWARQSGDFQEETPDDIPGFTRDTTSLHHSTFVVQRHPDYVTPRTWFHILGIFLYDASNVLARPDVVFAAKASLLLSLLSFPAYFVHTAWIYNTERGLWVLIMAALTSSQYVGETTFGFYIRIVGTLFGATVGLAVWYVGNGHGNGSPYGMGAIFAVVVPFLMFFRLHFMPPPSAIFPVVTACLVIGYSWQNSTRPTITSVGYGWEVAWKRFVCVTIGISSAFLWSLLPPKATRRESIRKTYANVIGEMGGVLCQIISFANCKEDDRKPPKQIIKNITALRSKVQKTSAAKGMVSYELSLRGAWPEEKYAALQTLQMEILDQMGQLLGVIASLNHVWTSALLHRTQLSNPKFLAHVLNLFHSVSNALGHNNPLPSVYSPLLEKFLRPLETLKAGHSYGYEIVLEENTDLPQHVDFDTICSVEYLRFSCGVSQCYAIVNRLDRLMLVAKSLVGESYIVFGLPHMSNTNKSESKDFPSDGDEAHRWLRDESARSSMDYIA